MLYLRAEYRQWRACFYAGLTERMSVPLIVLYSH